MDYQQQLIQQIFRQSLGNKTDIQTTNEESVAAEQSTFNEIDHPAIAVYHNNYIETGIRALSIGFSTVAGIMHETDFRRLARNYLLEYPKQCFDWADYGSQFAEFMFDIDALSHMPFLPELAELDWRLMHIERQREQAFDTASFALLETEDATTLKFVNAPGLQLMRAIFPIKELYDLVHNELLNQDSAESQAARQQQLQRINKLINLAIKSGSYGSIVLYRKDYKGLFEYTKGQALMAFESMLAEHNIATVLSQFEDDQAAMTKWLQMHIQTQKIYAVVVSESSN